MIHLFTTDRSGLELLRMLPAGTEASAVIVPSNRFHSHKVRALCAACPVPLCIHHRGERLPDGLPPADAAVSWLYSQIIDAADLACYPGGVLNMHGGRIPEYRGANVLNWAVANGEDSLGITWHGLVEAVDAGPIYAESQVPIGPEDTAWDVRGAMLQEGLRLFPEAWQRFVEGEPLRQPDLSGGRVWPPRRPSDGHIGEGWPEARLRAMLRAQCAPWPPATVEHDGKAVAVRGIVARSDMPYRSAEGHILYLAPADEGEC
ncbi:MAG: formyltransferase family protein [Alphaproteobacteria bacterium]|nr:formyltransferase family protein [Alphaproteobacteria bacterium]